FRFVLDASPLSASVDRSSNANKGVELGIISDEAWVRYNGLDDKDLASIALRKRRMLERMVLADPALGPSILPILYPDDPEIQAALENWSPGGGAPPGGPEGAPGAPGGLGAPAPGDSAGSVPGAAPPLPGEPQLELPPLAQRRLVDLDPEVVAALLAAAHVSVDRALERGANRLISRVASKDKEFAERLRRERRTDVLSIAGAEWAVKTGLGAESLFAGSWDQFAAEATEWLRNAMIESGSEPYEAGQVAEVAAGELATQLTNLCASALNKPLKAGANGFKVPTDLVLSALAAGDLARSSG
ncbi:MAG TPA: hypothetical protein VMX12_00250, partial [Acidimicrobiia bacterium]|nr:hypothetical protein [Acidimicrobiia bacterium]